MQTDSAELVITVVSAQSHFSVRCGPYGVLRLRSKKLFLELAGEAMMRLRRIRQAFSLLEVVISLFLVGTIMVVALEALTAATKGRRDNGNRARASLLANSLIQEILDQAYLEPDDTATFRARDGGGNKR